MLGNRRRDTSPERKIRSILHRRGLRFRKDQQVRIADVRTRPDILFTRARIAVYVDGCFWHRCPDHGTEPRSNTAYWAPKLDGNIRRDRRVDAALAAAGWTVIRIWEHEPPEQAADRVIDAVRDAHPSRSRSPAVR